MIVFYVLYGVLFGYIIGAVAYLALLTTGAFRFHKPANPSAPPLRIAMVIPAHNEQMQIAPTVEMARRMDYPRACFQIFVIADNCDDDTAAYARMAGATVMERQNPDQRGKGQALDWFFRRHPAILDRFDAVAVIDADTLADVKFLRELSASLSVPGVQIVQGFYGGDNARDSWRAALDCAALNVFNHLRAAGRRHVGGSAGLKGNGMAFRSAILKYYGWPAHSKVEDLEFTTTLLLDGIVVDYNPDAIVQAEMAITRSQADSQRQRWEGGRWQAVKALSPKLLHALLRRPCMAIFDGLMELLIAPLAILALGLILLGLLTWALLPPALPVVGLAFAAIVCYVLAGQIQRRAPLHVWIYLFGAPVFVLGKVPMYLNILRGKTNAGWVRTRRKSELTAPLKKPQ